MTRTLRFDETEYLKLLDLFFQVAQSLKGKRVDDHRMPPCHELAMKIFCHAATIWQLHQGTRVPIASIEAQTDFYDHTSIAVLTRTVLETYLNQYEVFFEPTSDDEREFRFHLWRLRGFLLVENTVPVNPEMQPQYDAAKDQISQVKERIQNTEAFARLSRKDQKEVLKKGERKRNMETRLIAAGFSGKPLKKMYDYYCSHTHADGLSGLQVLNASGSKKDQISLTNTHMQVVIMVLAKTVLDYAHRFSEAKAVCDSMQNESSLARTWAGVAKAIP